MNKIVVFVIASVLLIFSSSISRADDSSGAAYDWRGLYVGLNAGWSRVDSDATTTTVFSPTGYFATTSPGAVAGAGAQKLDSDTFTGGGQLGYNWQAGSWVFGGESDFNYLHGSDSCSVTAGYPCCAPTDLTVGTSMSTNWMSTVRPRIGYAKNNWLFYVTGGLAVARVNANFDFTDTFASASEHERISKTKTGWTVGGGVEVGLTKNWSIKTEYLYADLGTIKSTKDDFTAFNPPINYPTNPFTHKIDYTTHTARVGLNYKF